jgi:hypothetical protein
MLHKNESRAQNWNLKYQWNEYCVIEKYLYVLLQRCLNLENRCYYNFSDTVSQACDMHEHF